jgi:translation initiation factor IF-2
MAKVRIYELAKKLNLSNKEVMDIFEKNLGIKVKSHSSTVEEAEAKSLEGIISSSTNAAKKSEPSAIPSSPTPAPIQKPSSPQSPVSTPEQTTAPSDKPKVDERKPQENRPQGQFPQGQRPGGFENRPQRPGGFENRPQGQFPQGQRPGGFENRPQRPGGFENRPQGQFPQGQRPGGFENRPQRPGGFENRPQGQFPQGQRPGGFENRPQRPGGFENRPQGQFPQGQRPGGFENRPQGQFPQGQRPGGFENRPQGQFPQGQRPGGFENRPQGQFPQGQRPGGFENRPQGQFPQGQRPGGFGGPRPNTPGTEGRIFRPDQQQRPGGFGSGPRRPQSPGGAGPSNASEAPLGKGTGLRKATPKKKDKTGKDAVFSKEEKLEQSKNLQEKFKKKRKSNQEEVAVKVEEVVIDKPVTVGELSSLINVSASEIVKELMMTGVLATVNQVIAIDTAKAVCEKLEIVVLSEAKVVESDETEAAEVVKVDESTLEHRAPVVTIMGHVDHGKTTLLDAIRSTKHKIVSGEVGGITQSIGAYSVKINDKKIVFLDTPGHEAFTAMRARGAQATDIAILVVAADDGIMPQTIEAINHAKAAKVPIIVAVNKIDKPGADADRVLQQLTEYGLVAEKWGGDTICVPVSALLGTNLDELLDYVLLVAEVENLRANPNEPASGVIIEAKLDKGKGAVATLLVQSGTLKVGDCIVAGSIFGKVRALISDEGERLKQVGPSTPVEVLGITEVPQSGDYFEVVENEKVMRVIAEERKELEKLTKFESMSPVQVRKEMVMQGADVDLTQTLNIIIKANTHGSAEAVSAAIHQLVSKQIFVKIVHIGVGEISEADVMLASASNALIIGYSVKEDPNALRTAQNEGVKIRKYDIIYQILEDIERTMLGLLQPEIKEVELGVAEVRQLFTLGKTTKIAGCYVLEGKIVRNKIAKVIRNGKEIFKGTIDQLKRFKDDAKEVAQGYECGISFSKFNDLIEGDIIRVSSMEEIERETLV